MISTCLLAQFVCFIKQYIIYQQCNNITYYLLYPSTVEFSTLIGQKVLLIIL